MSDTISRMAQEILRLGNECRALADENTRLKEEAKLKAIPVEAKLMDRLAELKDENTNLTASVHQLRKELADLQESWHLVNETLAKLTRKTTK